jgi:hypothetical protein
MTTTKFHQCAAASCGPSRPCSHRFLIDFVLLGAIWGASFLFMRWPSAEFGALPAAAMRVAIAPLPAAADAAAKGHGARSAGTGRPSSLIGVLNSGLPFAAVRFALLSITTGLSASSMPRCRCSARWWPGPG